MMTGDTPNLIAGLCVAVALHHGTYMVLLLPQGDTLNTEVMLPRIFDIFCNVVPFVVLSFLLACILAPPTIASNLLIFIILKGITAAALELAAALAAVAALAAAFAAATSMWTTAAIIATTSTPGVYSYFAAASLACQRLALINFSPIIASFSSFLIGLDSIRAFNRVPAFVGAFRRKQVMIDVMIEASSHSPSPPRV